MREVYEGVDTNVQPNESIAPTSSSNKAHYLKPIVRAFYTSQKALLLEFSSRLSIANAREIFQRKRGTVSETKETTSVHKSSVYPSYETPSTAKKRIAQHE